MCERETAVDWKGERAAKQGEEEVFRSVWAHRLCWEEEVRYKENKMSPQPLGANLKPALSFKTARVTAAHLCCLGFRCFRLMSAHISVQMLFPVGIGALTGRPIRHRDEETAVFWFLCARLPQGLSQGSHPEKSYARENLSNVGVRGKNNNQLWNMQMEQTGNGRLAASGTVKTCLEAINGRKQLC